MPDFNSVIYKKIGYRISELRKYNNDNQQQLAEKINIGRSSISNFESGRQHISLHLLYRIAQVYNTEVHTLIPTVSEIASKVSLEVNKVNEVLDQTDVGDTTKNIIQEILNQTTK